LQFWIFFGNFNHLVFHIVHPFKLECCMSAVERLPISIPKEQVNALRFPKVEVLRQSEDVYRRRADLERAVMLGNVEKNKVRIVFEVETTIWSITDDRVILKGDGSIPVCRVHQVIA
jgi:hypothetical protein